MSARVRPSGCRFARSRRPSGVSERDVDIFRITLVYSSPCELATPGLFSRLRDGGWETRGLAEKDVRPPGTADVARCRGHTRTTTRADLLPLGPLPLGPLPLGPLPLGAYAPRKEMGGAICGSLLDCAGGPMERGVVLQPRRRGDGLPRGEKNLSLSLSLTTSSCGSFLSENSRRVARWPSSMAPSIAACASARSVSK
jgi:hypothetical protein